MTEPTRDPMQDLGIDPWWEERYEYGEIHEVAVKLSETTHGYRTLVVREIEGTQLAPDPNVIGTFNRLGEAGWQISQATMESKESIERNPWVLENVKVVEPRAQSIYYWKSRQMKRRLPYREAPREDQQ